MVHARCEAQRDVRRRPCSRSTRTGSSSSCSSVVGDSLGLNQLVPSIAPRATTMASQGLTSDARSGVDRPGPRLQLADETVVHAPEVRFLASCSSRSPAHCCQIASDMSRTSGCSIRLNHAHQPRRPAAAGSGWSARSRSFVLRERGRCDRLQRCEKVDERWLSGSARPLAACLLPALAPACCCPAPSTRRSRATRGSPSGWRGCCRSTSTTRSGSSRRDGAPADVAAQRRAGVRTAWPRASRDARAERSRDASAAAAGDSPDLQFTSRYRVPFQFSRYVARASERRLAFVQAVGRRHRDRSRRQRALRPDRLVRRQRLRLRLLQGLHRRGHRARARAWARCSAPTIRSCSTTSAGCRQISGLDEVSFHMSGTEAVMQAVRLARYHTGRSHLVRFCGAYHGWWDDVQPGVGNPAPVRDAYTLKEMDAATLQVLGTPPRHRLRAGQPAAGAASERRRAWRRHADRRAIAAPVSIARRIRRGCARCAPSARSGASC